MRPSIQEYYSAIAVVASARSTCRRRKVGAVLVDKDHRLLSIGYNGNPSGHQHCIDHPCPGAFMKSGTGLDKCESIHAEINAIGSCLDLHRIQTCYSTTSPCIHCVKSLLATNCQEIVFLQEYPHSESKALWEKSGRIWTHYQNEKLTEVL